MSPRKPHLARTVLALLLLFCPSTAFGQFSDVGMLDSSDSFNGRISPAFDTDAFTFAANAGEGIQLRLAEIHTTSLTPKLTVYRPDGSYYTSSYHALVAEVYFDAPVGGMYTVVVEDGGGAGATGAYRLHYTRAPRSNEHGTLVNGGSVTQYVGLGDLDSYTFHAGQGEGVQLRVADTGGTSLSPNIWVYRPGGSYYTSSYSTSVAEVYFDAPESGTYTVLVMDGGTGGYADTGFYELHFTRAPGANEHGQLVNGGSVRQQVGLGDLDSYTFQANQGEGVQLRVVNTGGTSLYPSIWVYRPGGSYYTSSYASTVAELYFDAPESGVYTVLVMDGGTGGYADRGSYELHYTRAPGAEEHGQLVNGGSVQEQIEVGDLDSYTFQANQGEGVQLRVADTGGTSLYPSIWVYRPGGSYYTSSYGSTVAELYFDAPESGVYTVLVMDGGTGGYADSGAYELHFTRAPGASEHGQLVSGGSDQEQIEVGDLDSYTFQASQGATVQLQMVDTGNTSLTPQIWVYRPSGSYFTSTYGASVATLDFTAPVAGTYTVVVMDGGTGGYADSGAYDLSFDSTP